MFNGKFSGTPKLCERFERKRNLARLSKSKLPTARTVLYRIISPIGNLGEDKCVRGSCSEYTGGGNAEKECSDEKKGEKEEECHSSAQLVHTASIWKDGRGNNALFPRMPHCPS